MIWLPPKTWHEDDGCSGVPDMRYYEACRNHDWRYRKLGCWVGLNARQSRRLSDIAFRYEMQNINGTWAYGRGWLRPIWRLVPWIWYLCVRVRGRLHFIASPNNPDRKKYQLWAHAHKTQGVQP